MLQEAYAPLPPSRALVPAKPRGRPTKYTPEIGVRILEGLASGRTLRSVCSDEEMPAASTVCLWASNKQSAFSEQYVRAREIGYLLMADELVEIADSKEDNPRCRAVRLATRQWILARCLPKVYGDKVQHDHSGSVTVTHENMLDRVRRLEIEGKL